MLRTSSPSSPSSLRRSLASSFSHLVSAAQGLSASLTREQVNNRLVTLTTYTPHSHTLTTHTHSPLTPHSHTHHSPLTHLTHNNNLHSLQLAVQLSEAVQSVGEAVQSLLHSSAVLQLQPGDSGVRERTEAHARAVARKVCTCTCTC